jgi:hypothetical protein
MDHISFWVRFQKRPEPQPAIWLEENMDIDDGKPQPPGERTWLISEYTCAFQDGERHLGHLLKEDQWEAYDATRLNLERNGIRYLGSFTDLDEAKAAVEASVGLPHASNERAASELSPPWIS